jgi:hypothetical protein
MLLTFDRRLRVIAVAVPGEIWREIPWIPKCANKVTDEDLALYVLLDNI